MVLGENLTQMREVLSTGTGTFMIGTRAKPLGSRV